MALVGNIYDIEMMFDKSEALQTLYKYLLESIDSNLDVYKRIISLDCNDDRIEKKIDIGFGMIAIEQSYKLSGGNFESHNKYVDFQLMIKGAEYMEFGSIDDFKISSEYDVNRDVILYHQNNDVSKILLKENTLAVFFPYDVHRGGLRVDCDIVYKNVIKVPHKLLKFCF